jgi:hypothetical protein
MQTLMVVVPDVSTKLLTQLVNGAKLPPGNDISLQRMKERFHMGVLARCASSGHALLDAQEEEALPKASTVVTPASVL